MASRIQSGLVLLCFCLVQLTPSQVNCQQLTELIDSAETDIRAEWPNANEFFDQYRDVSTYDLLGGIDLSSVSIS